MYKLFFRDTLGVMSYSKLILSFVFSVFVFFGCCSSTNPESQVTKKGNDFVIFTSQYGNYSFLATNSVDFNKIEQMTYDNKNYNTYIYQFIFKDYIFSSFYYHVPIDKKYGIENEIDILLDNMIVSSVSNSNGKLISSEKINYYKIQGKEYITDYVDGRSVTRLYVDEDKKVYALVVQSTDRNDDFDNPIIQTFLNSFYLKGLKNTKAYIDNIKAGGKKGILSFADMELLMLSDLATSDNFLQLNKWKKIQEIHNKNYGIGYQYFVNKDAGTEQVIVYPNERVVIYFPNEVNYKKLLALVTKEMDYVDVVKTYGENQDLYTNGKYRVMINSAKKVISFAWGS